MVQQHTGRYEDGGNSNTSKRTAGRERGLETIHSQNCLKRNNAKVDTRKM
jgi:hypothetical protein